MLYPKSDTIGLQLVVNLHILNLTISIIGQRSNLQDFFFKLPIHGLFVSIDLRKPSRAKQVVTRYSYLSHSCFSMIMIIPTTLLLSKFLADCEYQL